MKRTKRDNFCIVSLLSPQDFLYSRNVKTSSISNTNFNTFPISLRTIGAPSLLDNLSALFHDRNQDASRSTFSAITSSPFLNGLENTYHVPQQGPDPNDVLLPCIAISLRGIPPITGVLASVSTASFRFQVVLPIFYHNLI
jgi:hypothetical protein